MFLLFVTLAVATGCSSVKLPPITTASPPQKHTGRFVWNDLLTDDVIEARKFYGDLLGWTFESVTPDYTTVLADSIPVAGIARRENLDPATPDSLWLNSISVADVDKAVNTVKENGGSVVQGPERLSGRGRMAVVRDTGGALIILLKSTSGDPPDRGPTPNAWVWHDLFTRDLNKSIDFYTRLTGCETKQKQTGSGNDVYLFREGRATAGIIKLTWRGVRPNWLPYIGVTDLAQTMERAQRLGADVLVNDDNAAILIDPTGAAVGFQQVKHHP
jgi:predicted enzyme related to lactoylglutathione lyase